MRARLWEADAQIERTTMPSLSEMIMDQLNLGKPQEDEAATLERYRQQL